MEPQNNLNINNWKLKLEERSRNRMKIQIKMGKDETEAFSNFMENLKPDYVSVDDFVRTIFYKGVEKFQEELMEKMKDYIVDNQDEIDASAIQALGDDASSLGNLQVIDE